MKKSAAVFVFVIVLAAALLAAATSQAPAPDTIFVNAVVFTGAPDGKRAQAIAVRGDRLIAVGSDADIRALKGSNTKIIDLGGRFVVPGFNDAHLHLANGGFEKLNVNLIGAQSLDEMKERIAARVQSAAPREWIVGRGWDHTKWVGASKDRLPTREDLDAVTGEHPAFFTRVDGHIAVANTAALKAAGITRETKAPEGGQIDRDTTGEATGILRETAMGLVGRHIPPPSPAQRRRAIELALEEAARWGVTSAQDNSSWEDFLVYENLQREGKLTLRITEWLPFDAALDVLQRRRAHHAQSDVMLRTGLLKGVMDGSLGSRTAALLAPYSDDPKNSGLPRYPQDQLSRMATERTAAGFQLGFHAIGDKAAYMALDSFAEAVRAGRDKSTPASQRGDYRFRIEHDQVLTPSQFAQYQQLKVIASVQPNHLLTDMNWAESRIGPERAKTSYPWRSFLKRGIPLAFGTDYPVEPITPFRGLYAAVTRKNEEGTKTYPPPDESVTTEQAIAAYTAGSAFAEFAENDKGTLTAGKLADFVVLDRDLTKVPPADILKTRVLRTVVGGRTVYEAR